MFSFSAGVKDASHIKKGLLNFSIDHSLSLKSIGFSIRKRESKDIVAFKPWGDNLLCSSKNCCFLVISKA